MKTQISHVSSDEEELLSVVHTWYPTIPFSARITSSSQTAIVRSKSMLTSSTVFTELMLVRLSARLCTVRTTEDNIYRLHKRRTCMQVFKICAIIKEINKLVIGCGITPLPLKDKNIPILKYFIYGFFKGRILSLEMKFAIKLLNLQSDSYILSICHEPN